ncbi:MAG: hypothetical protein KAI24_23320 [Planctomycetes bacterium]|nr:hypothetical protein [Planctomycetota bacterium]
MKSLVALVVAVFAAAPCLWDSDTLDTELRGLPDAFDLVVGRWHRHGDAYYRARVSRLAAKQPLTLAECDDLAVAYEHLDERDRAIEVMAKKAELLEGSNDDEHRYRYHANLGTFYAHAGRYDEALVELRKAVAINPAAHFGRENFQIELIEYVAAARTRPELWTQQSFLRHAGYRLPFVLAAGSIQYDPETHRPYPDWNGDRELDWDKAYKAIGGMLRFGGLEGPELYRALGELFLCKEHLNLAWWAYARAIERGHPAADNLQAIRRDIESHWQDARKHSNNGFVPPTAELVRTERAKADAWVLAFQQAEAEAIARGEDVRRDATLKRLLAIADGDVPTSAQQGRDAGIAWATTAMWSGAAIAGLIFAVVLLRRARGR